MTILRILLAAVAMATIGGDEAINLSAALDRPGAVYAVGDSITITLSASRDVGVRLWLRAPSGKLTPVIPSQADGAPVYVRAGDRARFPRTGGFQITPPAGKYAFLITATTDIDSGRSLLDADSRLAGQSKREQRMLAFNVENI
ncbi:DUF4384 domain-containing protein [Sphingomonas sp. GB1N7]|uniref:DUF4384 domain-containing protein n=1 Tax=Parasphingomonas caseinilytica TaxID=3096158 RepID=UPI002FC848E7